MNKLTKFAIVILVIIIGLIVGFRVVGRAGETVEVVHWATGHLLRPGLLQEMSKEFNKAHYRTTSGKEITVRVCNVPSELQGKYLSELLIYGTRMDLHKETNGYVEKNLPDPSPDRGGFAVELNYWRELLRPIRPMDDLQTPASLTPTPAAAAKHSLS